MKILQIGEGTIGKPLFEKLSKSHDVVLATRKSVENPVDLASKESIEALFKKTGSVDAVVVCGGATTIKMIDDVTDEDIKNSCANKLIGQMNIVRVGMGYVKKGGSITLVSGYLNRLPRFGCSIAAMVDGGIEDYAASVAHDLKGKCRVNVVSPGIIEESIEKYTDAMKTGLEPMQFGRRCC